MITQKIHDAIAAICPIKGISIGSFSDKATWSLVFDQAATDAQKQAAQAAINFFDVAAAQAKESSDETSLVSDTVAAKTDPAITTLKTMTPAQARIWVQTNVNSLPDAKALLGTMAAVLCVLARKI